MANLGPIPVPSALEPVLPYVKFVVGLLGVIATVVVATVAAPPAWIYIIISVATALGVFTAKNKTLADDALQLINEGELVYHDGKAILTDVKTGNIKELQVAGNTIVTDVKQTAVDASAVAADLQVTLPVAPVTPVAPASSTPEPPATPPATPPAA